MPSETDCLNDALGQIGANRITSIDDGSINAEHCKVFYPPLRDGLIRSHHWNFAQKRVQLAVDAQAPAFEFAFSFTLPADSLKVIGYTGADPDTTTIPLLEQFNDPNLPRYKIEARKLLTNDGTVSIIYLARITDPNIWDGMFYQLVASWLASKLAKAIMKDAKTSRELLSEAVDLILPLAAAVDGQEGTVDPMVVPDLISGRF